jgi:hypothetical protein
MQLLTPLSFPLLSGPIIQEAATKMNGKTGFNSESLAFTFVCSISPFFKRQHLIESRNLS